MTLNRLLLIRLVPVVALPTILLGIVGIVVSYRFISATTSTAEEIQQFSEATQASGDHLVKSFTKIQEQQNEFALRNVSQLIDIRIEYLKDILASTLYQKRTGIFIRGDASIRAHLTPVLKADLQNIIDNYDCTEIVLYDSSNSPIISVSEYIIPEGANPISGGYFWSRNAASKPEAPPTLEPEKSQNSIRLSIDWYKNSDTQKTEGVLTLDAPLKYTGITYSSNKGTYFGRISMTMPLQRLFRSMPNESLESGLFAIQAKDLNHGLRNSITRLDLTRIENLDSFHLFKTQAFAEGNARLALYLDSSQIDASIEEVISSNRSNSLGTTAISDQFHGFQKILKQSFWVLGACISIFISGAIFIVIRIAKSIAQPIVDLEKGSALIRDGDYNHNIDTQANVSEVRNLARVIDEMRKRLYTEISERDQAVLNRTNELITSNQQLEQEVIERRRAEEKAKAASNAKSDFVATISHEIRTPLNGIIGSIDLLSKSMEFEEEQRELIDTAESSSELLLGIVNDVLDYSKIEAGLLELKSEPFYMKKLIQESEQLFASHGVEKGLNFHSDIDPSVLKSYNGDIVRIKQILANLLSNAFKFTEQGEVTLKVSSKQGDKVLPDMVHFAIKDSGIGIPQGSVENLFDPFTQLDNYSTRRVGGTGLGLSICKKLATLMGGSIFVESTESVGSTFNVLLPLTTAEYTESTPNIETAPSSDEPVNLHVLVVDDNRVNQKVATRMLKKQGHTSETANNGKEAIEILQTTAFDVVLMDCQMPVMDGFEATRAIRSWPKKQLNSQIPIIALTANASSSDRDATIAAGMDAFLPKPIRSDTLRQQILSVISQSIKI